MHSIVPRRGSRRGRGSPRNPLLSERCRRAKPGLHSSAEARSLWDGKRAGRRWRPCCRESSKGRFNRRIEIPPSAIPSNNIEACHLKCRATSGTTSPTRDTRREASRRAESDFLASIRAGELEASIRRFTTDRAQRTDSNGCKPIHVACREGHLERPPGTMVTSTWCSGCARCLCEACASALGDSMLPAVPRAKASSLQGVLVMFATSESLRKIMKYRRLQQVFWSLLRWTKLSMKLSVLRDIILPARARLHKSSFMRVRGDACR